MKANVRKDGKRAVAVAAVVAVLLVVVALLVARGMGASGAAGGDGPSVSPKASWADYSWSELADIAESLSACENDADATNLAARFGLCDDAGALDAHAGKEVPLAGGREARAFLVGIRADERTDGGRAGLTFALVDVRGSHAMNHGLEALGDVGSEAGNSAGAASAYDDAGGLAADSVGGWAASDMRSWLNGQYAYALPADLRGALVSVQKRTANTVGADDELDEAGKLAGSQADWVSETSDMLWLFSASEVCGSVPARADLGVDDTMAAVYAGEGAQYRLFADGSVTAFEPNGLLAIGSGPGLGESAGDDAASAKDAEAKTWWLRTKTLEFANGFWLVGTDGTPLNGLGEDARVAHDPTFAPDDIKGPDHARSLVVGFCL